MSSVRNVKAGRPAGTVRFDAEIAVAFGQVVRATRLEMGLAQEALSAAAGVERSHIGKIERGEHAPQLALVFAIAGALGVTPSLLLAGVGHLLATKNKP